MKTDTLKKFLLDYVIKGRLTAKLRRENSELSAPDELETYNDKIKQKRKNLEKELKTLELKLKEVSTCHCETSAGSRGKTSEAVRGVAETGFFSNPQTKHELKSQVQSLKKEIIRCKEITPLSLSESPFTIPDSWAWVKLGDICEIVSGGTPSRDKIEYWHNGIIPWVKMADVKNNVVNQTQEFITGLGLENSSAKIFKRGTLLYTMFVTLGETTVLNIDVTTNQVIVALIEAYDYDTKFLVYCLMSMKDHVNSLGRSVTQNNINQTALKNFIIPLPPLCEQQEIAKKLDLFISLANDFAITRESLKRIEKRTEKRIEKSLLRLALKGSLNKLYRRNSPTLCAFDEISTYNDEIKRKHKDLEREFKKCEKEFKLEKDKDRKVLCKSQIQMLKKELTKCKEITPLNLSEAPFTISNSWAWVRLGDICEMKKGPSGSAITKDMFTPDGNNAVKIYEQKNAIQKSETLGEYYISLEHFEKLKQFEIFENDIIVSCAGTIGEIFRIPENAPKGIINQALMKIKLANEEWIPYFMTFFDFLIKQKSQENSKDSVIKNIPPLDILKNFSIPLPPLQEQEYITQILGTPFTLKKGLRVD